MLRRGGEDGGVESFAIDQNAVIAGRQAADALAEAESGAVLAQPATGGVRQ